MSQQAEELFQIQLGLLVEAGGRVQLTTGKVLRWGLGSVDVVTGESNRDGLLRDLDDLKVSIKRIETALTPASAPLRSPNIPQLERLTQATEDAVRADLAAANVELGPGSEVVPTPRMHDGECICEGCWDYPPGAVLSHEL